MNIYWGDIHNHCAITYGLGSLTNALDAAKRHLDFVSVTPHAFWPDIPERTPDTDFLVDFHEKGFSKIAKNWDAVKDEIDRANVPGEFSTLFSFEMHSSRWGDHHFVSPDKTLEIAKMNTPNEVIKACGARTIAIAHHIGYTPGYRGINWEGFDEGITPVIEVVSKHGCSMRDDSGFPYYHDMGPLDPRKTVSRGLLSGRRFGFVGSTDHHAGFPGSFGDGKLALLAEENTREAVFEALCRRRTYAVTGSRILCGFNVNSCPMGSFIPASGQYAIDYDVEASSAIDRIVIYRDMKPMRIVDGLTLTETGGLYKVRLELGWGDNADEPYRWDAKISVDGGRIVNSEPCVRGRSVLSPTQRVNGGDDINRPNFSLTRIGDGETRFMCETYRNNSTLSPSTAMVVTQIEGNGDTLVSFEINGITVKKRMSELLYCGLSGHVKPYNSQAFKIHTAVPKGRYAHKGSVLLPDDGAGFYHMEVRQLDGDAAYVSPVFINR